MLHRRVPRRFKCVSRRKCELNVVRPSDRTSVDTIEVRGIERDEITPQGLSRCSTQAARRFITLSQATELQVLPLAHVTFGTIGTLSVAVDRERESAGLMQDLRFISGQQVNLVPVSGMTLQAAILKAYHGDESRLSEELQNLEESRTTEPAKGEFLADFHPSTGEAAQFLATLIEYAIAKGATDLHLVPTTEGTQIRMRIAGEMHEASRPIGAPEMHREIVGRLRVLARVATSDRDAPIDGHFIVPDRREPTQVRLSIMPTIRGEKAVLRFLGKRELLALDALGLNPLLRGMIERFTAKREGTALFAGATGSGKTTTLYAIMGEFQRKNVSLVSIEDPVEIELKGIAQTSVNEKTGLTYDVALRALLRQDPDVILIGEIRDTSSAQIAFQAAMTGHQILTTVHARSVVEVFRRLEYLGLDRLTVTQAVSLIVCQRLVPKLCQSCRVVDLARSNQLGFPVYRPAGCHSCDYHGTSGMILLAEALEVSPEIGARLCREELSSNLLAELLERGHYLSPNAQLTNLVQDGIVSALELGC